MRECINCEYSRGIGSDVWCGDGHTEYETYMRETDCPYYKRRVPVMLACSKP